MGAPIRLKDRVPHPKRIGAHSWLGRAEGDVEITRTATYIFEHGAIAEVKCYTFAFTPRQTPEGPATQWRDARVIAEMLRELNR